MPEVTANAAPGTPCWVDLGIPDAQRAMEFYRAVFGWEFTEAAAEYGGYINALKNGKKVAGIMGQQDAPAAWWGMYFATDDCAGSVKRATDAGAQVVAPTMDVGPLGSMAIMTDPAGAQFGFWEGREHTGCELVNESGALAWNELVTGDSAASAAFYRSALDVQTTPIGMEGIDYLTVDVAGRPVCGIFGVPESELQATGGTARWTTYFGVDDADEAARICVQQGGSVARPAQDSPFGRFAVLKDPFGAEFAAMKLAEAPPTM